MIYLDNAATTQVRPEVRDVMVRIWEEAYGNPSSLHPLGVEADRLLRSARSRIARLLGARAGKIVFTSGGTEANNLAIKGAAAARRGGRIVATRVEHPSVLACLEELAGQGFDVDLLDVDSAGTLRLDALDEALEIEPLLVSVMAVNNEIGTVQPVAEVARRLKARWPEALLHVDAVQAFGRLSLRPEAEGVDLMSVSAHKLHGPKGVGALFIREGAKIKPLLSGGGQEGGLRSGTENVAGIAGFAEAARLAYDEMEAAGKRLRRMKARLWEAVSELIPDVRCVGPSPDEGASHILCVGVAGVQGEVLVRVLGELGVHASTGSACSSRSRVRSHVLDAVGLPEEYAKGALRLSLSPQTEDGDIEQAAEKIAEAVRRLRGGRSI